MKKFEYEIRKRMHIKIALCIVGGIAFLTAIILKLCIQDSGQVTDHISVAMLAGMFGGVEAFSIPTILHYKKALKNKESLETLHINETDERNQMVELKTCQICFYITLTLLGYAGMVAAFFSKTVFYTLGFILILLCIIYLIVKVITTRKSY